MVAQDTGWSRWLPPGEGVFAFTTPDEALTAVETVRRNYSAAARAARALAERHFDSDIVLPAFLKAVGAS